MSEKYYIQQRAVPAACRSARLRAAGVKPTEAYGLMQWQQIGATNPDTESNVWIYNPGNTPDHAILVERGAWNAMPEPPYYYKSYNPETHVYERHAAWHNAIRWHACIDETKSRPSYDSPGWKFADNFFGLIVEVSADVSDHFCSLKARVFGRTSGEEILPVSSIPASGGWSFDVKPDNYRTGIIEDWLNDQLGEDPRVTPVIDRETLDEVTSMTATYHLRMTVGGYYQEYLRDSSGNILYDETGEALYIESCVYPMALMDSAADSLTDSDGDILWCDDEIPEPEMIEVHGSINIEF